VERCILGIRGEKVILDADLAALYGVSTKALNQAVRRNSARFPEDFAFLLTPEEKTEVVTNCDHLRRLRFSPVSPRAVALREIFEKLRQLMAPPPPPPKPEIGFHVKEDALPYRIRKRGKA